MRATILGMIALVGVSCAAPTLRDQSQAIDAARITALGGSGPPRRVLLITVAGLESADFLNARGQIVGARDQTPMPNLARLAREGSIGIRAHPPTPASSYASHATLVTGRLPKRHGVVADQALDETGNRSLPFWDNRLLNGIALWDAAIGRGVLSLGWPTTRGARIELLVPDGRSIGDGTSWLEEMRILSTPMLMRELDAMAAAAGNSDEEGVERPGWPTAAEKDALFADLVCRVVESERDPGLWLIRFDQTATYLHLFGYGSVEVVDALSRVDAAIGQIGRCLADAGQLGETAIFVSGDVTYQPVHTLIDPNVVLVRNGLIGRDPRASTGARSWLAISRSNGRSAYVYAQDAENALKARALLEDEAIRTGAFEVVSASELAGANADPQAWFGLAAMPGFTIGNGLVRPSLRLAEMRASAGAFPFRDLESSSVGFVAWGRGIRSGIRLPSLELVDIAPTIAALLGLRLDERLEGESLVSVLRAVAKIPPPGPKRLGVDTEADADRALREMGGRRKR